MYIHCLPYYNLDIYICCEYCSIYVAIFAGKYCLLQRTACYILILAVYKYLYWQLFVRVLNYCYYFWPDFWPDNTLYIGQNLLCSLVFQMVLFNMDFFLELLRVFQSLASTILFWAELLYKSRSYSYCILASYMLHYNAWNYCWIR